MPAVAAHARWTGSALFFPAAALHGAIVLPWSVLAMTGTVPGPAALATGAGHAHEMLLGFALAVVAGHQLAPLPRTRLLLLFVLWAAARVAFLAGPPGIALGLEAVFAASLGAHIAPRLFRAAKKWRNQALPAVLSALCLGAVALDAAAFAHGSASSRAIATALVLLLATLMLFMGGRIVAPAAAGQMYRQGGTLDARVQPRIEAALVVVMALAIATVAVASLDAVTRLACACAGTLALARLARWRLWACRRRPDLWCLGAGYAWIGLGLLAIAAGDPVGGRTTALHVVTVGALGTLTFNVMTSTMLRKAGRNPATEPLLVVGTLLLGIATASRIAAGTVGANALPWLLAGAACWGMAFVVSGGVMLSCRRRRARAASGAHVL